MTEIIINKPKGPQEITPQNIQYFSHHTGQFEQSQVNKAKKFVEHNCLDYLGDNLFQCGPIIGYNKRTYTLKKGPDGEFSCNCQFFVTKGKMCSHILALYYAFRLKYFQKHNKYNHAKQDQQ